MKTSKATAKARATPTTTTPGVYKRYRRDVYVSKKTLEDRICTIMGPSFMDSEAEKQYRAAYWKHRFLTFKCNPKAPHPGVYWQLVVEDETHPLHEAVIKTRSTPDGLAAFETWVTGNIAKWEKKHEVELRRDLETWATEHAP